jgi:hypothetical protein
MAFAGHDWSFRASGGIRKAWFQTWPQWTTHCSHAERSPCWPTKHQVQIKHCVRLHCIIIWGAQRQSLMPFPGFCSSNTELMDLSAKFIPMFRYVCWLNYHVSSLPSYKARKNDGHSTMHRSCSSDFPISLPYLLHVYPKLNPQVANKFISTKHLHFFRFVKDKSPHFRLKSGHYMTLSCLKKKNQLLSSSAPDSSSVIAGLWEIVWNWPSREYKVAPLVMFVGL